MKREYWERIAPAYHEEIFDVRKNDTRQLITRSIRKAAAPGKTVLDAGTAVGKWIPVLSPLFRKVIAADISAANLDIARREQTGYHNVEYLRADLSGTARLPSCDVVVCINAILTDDARKRERFFVNITSALRKNGTLVLVVPSLESWLLTRIIQDKWKIDRKLFGADLPDRIAADRYRLLTKGNAEIDDVPTKHYLGEELSMLLTHYGYTAGKPQQIRYTWETEFVKPPVRLPSPGPWDWLIVAQKK